MRNLVLMFTLSALTLYSVGCQTRAAKGGALGAVAGGAVGALIGERSDHTALGAILGAAVGGAAGAYIGRYMDNQAQELDQDLADAKVERVGEGIKITFASGLLFDVGQSTLRQETTANLTNLARILGKYEKTNVLIEGHTDATGSEEFNQALSERRAQAVAAYLEQLKVDAARFTTRGYGESQPVATNDTPEGRQENRRVDVAIMANEELKAAAQQGS